MLQTMCGLRSSDSRTYATLIDLHRHGLMRYLLSLTGHRELAEDLFQETWIRALVRGAQYEGNASFDSWLFTIARNLVVDYSRKRKYQSLDEMNEANEDHPSFEVEASDPSVLHQLEAKEAALELRSVLSTTRSNYREVL